MARKSLLEKERALKTRGGVKRRMVQECREEGRREERKRKREKDWRKRSFQRTL